MATRQSFKDWFLPRHKLEKDKVESFFDSITFRDDDGVGHAIEDNGAPITKRKKINVVGATVTDDPVNDAIILNLAGGSVHDKGWFVDNATLVATYPAGDAGWYAVVASTNTFWIWNVATSLWENSGNTSIVSSVNTKTGAVALTAADIPQTSTLLWLTNILKALYDSAVVHTQIILGNPHNTSASDVGAYSITQVNNKIAALPYYATGVYQLPTILDNANGSVTLGAGEYCLFDNTAGKGFITKCVITGSTLSLTDASNNFIVANYASGTPALQVVVDVNIINNTTVVKVFEIFRNGNILHIERFVNSSNHLSNQIEHANLATNKFRYESGLSMALVGTRNLLMSMGSIFVGSLPTSLAAIDTSLTDKLIFYYHNLGVWTFSATNTQISNSQYDNGLSLQSVSSNNYAVSWIFRGSDEAKATYVLLGTADYSLFQAQTCKRPTLPPEIATHAIYVGKIIIKQGMSSATLIQSAFDHTQNAPIQIPHNETPGIEGGDDTGKYHLTLAEIETVRLGGAGLELGETALTAFRGDEGKIAYDHSQSAHVSASDLNSKVDKVLGSSLIADSEITRLAAMNEHFRGTHLTLAALQAAVPIGAAGNEAVVDAGVGSDPQKYIWDVSDNAWKLGGGGSVTVDQSVINGSTNAVSGGAVYNELALVQKLTDNTLVTANKTVVGAINELNAQNSANQLTGASIYMYYNFV